MPSDDLYLGSWELVPELSLHEFGPLPAGCDYELAERDGEVRVGMRWTLEPGGEELRQEFGGPADGSRLPLDESGAVSFSLTRVDARTLESRAFRGGEELAFARRVASRDGDLLAIVQEGRRPDGGTFRNFQVYRRRPRA